jgi:hypothetical protein
MFFPVRIERGKRVAFGRMCSPERDRRRSAVALFVDS